MTISNYAELQTAIANWSERDDLTDRIPEFIALAEARIYRDLRIRAMETALSSAISSGVIAVPAGYVEMKHAYIDGSSAVRIHRKTPEWIYRNYPTRSSSGKPIFFAREGENIIFGPYPDSGYTVKGIYYKRLPALSATNTTNWFTDNEPGILLFSALYVLADYVADAEASGKWAMSYESERSSIQAKNDAEEFSGSPLSISAA